MPKGNIIDLEKRERALLDVKEFAKKNGVILKTNQQLVEYSIEMASKLIKKHLKQ